MKSYLEAQRHPGGVMKFLYDILKETDEGYRIEHILEADDLRIPESGTINIIHNYGREPELYFISIESIPSSAFEHGLVQAEKGNAEQTKDNFHIVGTASVHIRVVLVWLNKKITQYVPPSE